jgi:hypothetical protein
MPLQPHCPGQRIAVAVIAFLEPGDNDPIPVASLTVARRCS